MSVETYLRTFSRDTAAFTNMFVDMAYAYYRTWCIQENLMPDDEEAYSKAICRHCGLRTEMVKDGNHPAGGLKFTKAAITSIVPQTGTCSAAHILYSAVTSDKTIADVTVPFRAFSLGKTDKRPNGEATRGNYQTYADALKACEGKQLYVLGEMKSGYIAFDFNTTASFDAVLAMIQNEHMNAIAIRSPRNGGHVLFADAGGNFPKGSTGRRTWLLLGTFTEKGYKGLCDYRTGPTRESQGNCIGLMNDATGEERKIEYFSLNDNGDLDEAPFYFREPKKLSKATKELIFLGMSDRDERSDAIAQYLISFKSTGFTHEQFCEVVRIINQYIFADPLSDNEIESLCREELWTGAEEYGSGGGRKEFRKSVVGNALIKELNICLIDGRLYVFNGQIYVPGIAGAKSPIRVALTAKYRDMTKNQKAEVIDYLYDCPEIEERKRSGPEYIAFKDCVYCAQTKACVPFSPKIVVTSQIPHPYPAKIAKSEVVIKAFEKLTCNRKELISLLFQAMGSCLYDSAKIGGGKAFMLTGERNNGKSTFLEFVKYVVGEENGSNLSMEQTSEIFVNCQLADKKFNVGDDIDSEYLPDKLMSTFKKVVTGEEITTREIYGRPFKMRSYATHFFSANKPPRIADPTGAVLRRLSFIPFDHKFSPEEEDYDPEFMNKLKTPDAATYALYCALYGMHEVLNNKRFTEPEVVSTKLADYAQLNKSSVQLFADEVEVSSVIGRTSNRCTTITKNTAGTQDTEPCV